MATIFDSEFIGINVSVLMRITGALPFDVSIRRADNAYTKLFPAGEPLDVMRVRSYAREKGVQQFYVQKEDYRQYLIYVERVANRLFDDPDSATDEDVLNIAKEMVDLTMFELILNQQVDERSVTHAATAMKVCLDILNRDPKSLVKILKMMASHPYMMKHSVATSMFALMLGRIEGLESDKALTALGLGGLLHDVGMSMIGFDAEDKEELRGEEFKEVRRHPELGKRILDALKMVPSEARTIVLQHHEQPNGAGYPNSLHSKEIYYLAKIVSIADSFSALVSKRPFRKDPYTPAKAIETMMSDRGKFDDILLAQFSKIFIHVK